MHWTIASLTPPFCRAAVIHCLEKQRQAPLHPSHLLLRKLRNCGGVWSDGRVVYRGVTLEKLRVHA